MTYITSLYAVAAHLAGKVVAILSTLQGWLLAVLLAIANFIAGYELALLAVVVCFLSDAVWGIIASRKRQIQPLWELPEHYEEIDAPIEEEEIIDEETSNELGAVD